MLLHHVADAASMWLVRKGHRGDFVTLTGNVFSAAGISERGLNSVSVSLKGLYIWSFGVSELLLQPRFEMLC